MKLCVYHQADNLNAKPAFLLFAPICLLPIDLAPGASILACLGMFTVYHFLKQKETHNFITVPYAPLSSSPALFSRQAPTSS